MNKWKERFLCGLFAILLCCTCAFGLKTYVAEKQKEYVGPSSAFVRSDIQSFEDLCEWSDTIVKATYKSKEEFTGSVSVFSFEVEESFTENVSENVIHVYESSESSFVKGKSYYLFLSSLRSSLYPHVVYSRLHSQFLLGELESKGNMSYTFYGDYNLDVADVTDFSEYIKTKIIETGSYMKNPVDGSGESLEKACKNADGVFKIRIVSLYEINPRVKVCEYIVEEVYRDRYNKKFAVVEDADKAIKEAAGNGEGYSTITGPADAEVGDDFILLQRYNEESDSYEMYSGEHFLYRPESEEGQYVLSVVAK